MCILQRNYPFCAINSRKMTVKESILHASHIQKRYGSLQVLKGVDLEVKRGEILAIVGASGAGKSTLLHIMGTLDTPDSGEIILEQKTVFDLNKNEMAAFRNRYIGFVFQFHNLLPEFTALENVMMPGLIAGTNEATLKKRANELLDLLGIASRADHKPSELSGGEQQRTAVARSLINAPSLILADEPSGNLDSNNAKELHKLFFELRDKMQQTFVIVTHNEELAGMADRKVEIRDGMIVKEVLPAT
jgi:lipoprotein-releasing system ATP-binding protein